MSAKGFVACTVRVKKRFYNYQTRYFVCVQHDYTYRLIDSQSVFTSMFYVVYFILERGVVTVDFVELY